jgi:hypothetical protein
MEVLVTMVTASLLLTAVYGAFLGSISAKRSCDEVVRTHRLGSGVVTLIRRDLEGAFIPPGEESALDGVPDSAQGGPADRVDFVTTSDARRAPAGEGRDHCEVGYRVDPDPDTPGMLRLIRREGLGISGSPFSGGTLEIVAEGVSSFELEYLSEGNLWTRTWEGPGLPRAARIGLVLRERNPDGEWGREVSFRKLVYIPSGG